MPPSLLCTDTTYSLCGSTSRTLIDRPGRLAGRGVNSSASHYTSTVVIFVHLSLSLAFSLQFSSSFAFLRSLCGLASYLSGGLLRFLQQPWFFVSVFFNKSLVFHSDHVSSPSCHLHVVLNVVLNIIFIRVFLRIRKCTSLVSLCHKYQQALPAVKHKHCSMTRQSWIIYKEAVTYWCIDNMLAGELWGL